MASLNYTLAKNETVVDGETGESTEKDDVTGARDVSQK